MAYGLTKSLTLSAASSQYAYITDNASLSITGDITIEASIKFTSLPGSGAYFAIVAKWQSSPTTNRSYELIQFNDSGTHKLKFSGRSAADGALDASVNWTPSTGTWYYIKMTREASSGDVKFYVNDVQQGTTQSTTAGNLSNGTNDLNVGAEDGTSFLNGQLSLVRIWSSINTGANQCKVLGSTSNLAAEWTFDNVYTDNSGSSNTLTASGSPTFTSDVPAVCSAVDAGFLAMFN